MQQTQQGHIRLYGCGGFGINITSHFEPAAGTTEPGHSTPEPVYIDTSRSNLKAGLNQERVFILEDVDGSGKVRRENHGEITKNVKHVLQKFPPKDLNVVVFSASGGSGSVFGPLIMAELLNRALPVVAIVVGSDESTITAQNTMNTLKSLEAIAGKAQLPVVICYEHNQADIKRSEIDLACRYVVASLSILASKQNAEMDSRDITNFLQFNRTTTVKPRLALIDVYRTNEEADAATQPVSIASLYTSPDDDKITVVPEYHAAGYPRAEIPSFKAAHFVINVDGVQVIAKRLQNTINELDTQRRSRVDHASIVGDNDEVTGDGMVL